MKKKLTLGLAQLIGPNKTDDLCTHTASPPPSPYPGRRAPLPFKVETELRAACTGVLLNTKPSHLYVAEEHSRAQKPQLDYEAVKRSASTRKSEGSNPSIDPTKYAYRPDTALEHLFAPGDSTHEVVQANILKRKPVPSDPEANARSRPAQAQRSVSAETSRSTPQTDVTEDPWNTSTAPTSAGITPARASKRASCHIQSESEQPAKADIAAIEWMRKELEKRRRRQAAAEEEAERQQPQQPQPGSRGPSRTRSITNNIKEYIRPSTAGSASGPSSRPASRSASRASLRAPSLDRLNGWKSWVHRKDDAKADVSRANSARGRSETRKGSSSNKPGKPNKLNVDLNRELPPLPSLDQWKDSEPTPTQQTLRSHQRTSSRHHAHTQSVDSKMSEVDEIVAARLGSPVKERPDIYQPTRSAKSTNLEPILICDPGAAVHADQIFMYNGPVSPGHMGQVLVPTRSRSTNRTHLATGKSTVRSVQGSQGEDLVVSPSSNRSVNYSRVRATSDACKTETDLGNTSAGFSKHRNYDSSSMPPALSSPSPSTDTATREHIYEQRYRHVMGVLSSRSPPPVPPKDDKKWWQIKGKNKKPMTWMDQLEKMGIKDGVLISDDVCGTPIIRY